jgi:hypothetical protein
MQRIRISSSLNVLLLLGVVALITITLVSLSAAAESDIQFSSIDFTTSVVELHNFGATDQLLDGWRLCSHSDDNGEFNYTSVSGLDDFTIEAGTSMFLWIDNNGPDDSNNIDIEDLAGNFASDLDQDAYSIGLYWPDGGSVQFGVSDDLADHLQWNLDGVDNSQADARSSLAETAGLWTDQDEWIATTVTTTRLELNDLTGGLLHGPDDYDVIEPNPADFDGDGNVNAADLAVWEASYNTNASADADNDGDSDGADFLIWQREFSGAPLASVSTVPEPHTALLLFLGLLPSCRKCRKLG